MCLFKGRWFHFLGILCLDFVKDVCGLAMVCIMDCLAAAVEHCNDITNMKQPLHVKQNMFASACTLSDEFEEF